MVETDKPSLFDRIVSACNAHAFHNPFGAGGQRPALPLTSASHAALSTEPPREVTATAVDHVTPTANNTSVNVADQAPSELPPSAPPPDEDGHGATPSTIGSALTPNIAIRFHLVFKEILFSSWLNVLLVFVPVGIAVRAAGVNPTVVFAVNAIAIIPLAGLLSHATESVASEMGDTIGALMNVTFGNAVELIILWVFLAQIRESPH